MEWGWVRAVIAVLSGATLLSSVAALVGGAGSADNAGALAALAVVAIALGAVTLLACRDAVPLFTASSTGPVADARCLRGAFRRQSSPDTPGRPRPRAPGAR